MIPKSILLLYAIVASCILVPLLWMVLFPDSREVNVDEDKEEIQIPPQLVEDGDGCRTKEKKRRLIEQIDSKVGKLDMSYFFRTSFPMGRWSELAFKVRAYKELFVQYDKVVSDYDLQQFRPMESLLLQSNCSEVTVIKDDALLFHLEDTLFPWSHMKYPTMLHHKRSLRGRGIVICVKQSLAHFAINLIQNIRVVHQSKLPIVIVQSGDELTSDLIEKFQTRWSDIRVINIDHYVDEKMLGGLKGFQIKPFGLFFSPFREAMLVDCDAVLLKSPDEFFEDPGYLTNGTLFFTDRTSKSMKFRPGSWLKDNDPFPVSDRVQDLRWFQQQTSFEMESGVVLINKEQHFVAALTVCLFNAKEEREVMYKLTYGDKETFWIGFEFVGDSFHMRPFPPKSLGAAVPKEGEVVDGYPTKICTTHILHSDINNKEAMWFNGGIQLVKSDPNNEVIDPSRLFYGSEGFYNVPAPQNWCLNSDDIRPVSDEKMIKVIQQTADLYKEDFELEPGIIESVMRIIAAKRNG